MFCTFYRFLQRCLHLQVALSGNRPELTLINKISHNDYKYQYLPWCRAFLRGSTISNRMLGNLFFPNFYPLKMSQNIKLKHLIARFYLQKWNYSFYVYVYAIIGSAVKKMFIAILVEKSFSRSRSSGRFWPKK